MGVGSAVLPGPDDSRCFRETKADPARGEPQPLPLTQATERHLPGVYVQRGLALPTSAPQEQAGADLRRGQEARGPQGSLKAPLLGEWLKALS